jgi:hypothetical protein
MPARPLEETVVKKNHKRSCTEQSDLHRLPSLAWIGASKISKRLLGDG